MLLFLFELICLGFAYGLLAAIFRKYYLDFLYCIIGAIIFSLFLVFVTQKVAHYDECRFSIDDYIFRALTLYFDIVRFFVIILRLFGGYGGGNN